MYLDEDECAGAADICGSGECVNMGGSFKCVCLPGFDVLVKHNYFFVCLLISFENKSQHS